jgi:hypothetical protein
MIRIDEEMTAREAATLLDGLTPDGSHEVHLRAGAPVGRGLVHVCAALLDRLREAEERIAALEASVADERTEPTR